MKNNHGQPAFDLAGYGGAVVYARRRKRSWLYAQLNWLRAQKGGLNWYFTSFVAHALSKPAMAYWTTDTTEERGIFRSGATALALQFSPCSWQLLDCCDWLPVLVPASGSVTYGLKGEAK
jgi:hypothetical protein